MAKVGRLMKESMLNELSTELTGRASFLVTRVNRLRASDADVLRQRLCASKGKFVMVQRRLGRRAIDGLKIPGLADLFEGSVGLVLPGEDLLPTAKLIVEFIKTHEEQLAIRGGVLEGQVLDKARVEQLASLPPKPMLLAQVVAMIEAPLAEVIVTVERLIGEIAWLAEQAARQKPAEATGASASEPSTASPVP